MALALLYIYFTVFDVIPKKRTFHRFLNFNKNFECFILGDINFLDNFFNT
jgi:hypothetical protein